MSKMPLIIDTDPGIDDAVALAIALNNIALDVKLITTVAGNVNVDHTTDNMLKLLEFFNKRIPVAKGTERPLLKEYEDASEYHGETGLNGYEFPKVKTKAVNRHAVEELRSTILNSKEKIKLIAIGPLTNIALLVTMYPEVKENISELVIMGGSISQGNTTSSAEFNIYVDPHAAQIVLQSGLNITMFGLNVTSRAILTKEDIIKIKECGSVGYMLYSLLSYYRGGSIEKGLRMHDVCTIAYLLKPEIFKFKNTYVEVALEGPAIGTTVADLNMKYHKKCNVNVCIDIDSDKFRELLLNEIIKIS